MIEANLDYVSGLKYSIKFSLDEKEIEKWLDKNVNDYNESQLKELLKIIKSSLSFSNPIVSAKWTTLKKTSDAKENFGGWGKKKQLVKKTQTTVQEERYL